MHGEVEPFILLYTLPSHNVRQPLDIYASSKQAAFTQTADYGTCTLNAEELELSIAELLSWYGRATASQQHFP